MTNAKDKVAGAAGGVRPYVERALNDDELRENVKKAYASGRSVYDQLAKKRSVSKAATRLATDQKMQNELRKAVEELREATERMKRGQPKKESHGGRNFLLLLTGAVVGALFNPVTGPALRRLLGKKLGGGSGFDYKSNGSGTN
jgi:response regulator RpfG family c-di-GMP phosphodiesterase